MTDQQIAVTALRRAGNIISDYLQPDYREPGVTLDRLIAVLDTQRLAAALDRLEKVVKGGEVATGSALLLAGAESCCLFETARRKTGVAASCQNKTAPVRGEPLGPSIHQMPLLGRRHPAVT